MRISILQHVDFEDGGAILSWADKHNNPFVCTHLYKLEPLPTIDSLDMLIIMGGPMGALDDDLYPFLKTEKKLIESCIKENKKVIGICLGAQLIADVCGAKVYKNTHEEIGWFPVQKTEAGINSSFLSDMKTHETVFHWHGDTFDVPAGAKNLLSSKATQNQAILVNAHTLGLQFHLETTHRGVINLINNAGKKLEETNYVQSTEQILEMSNNHIARNNEILYNILDSFALPNS